MGVVINGGNHTPTGQTPPINGPAFSQANPIRAQGDSSGGASVVSIFGQEVTLVMDYAYTMDDAWMALMGDAPLNPFQSTGWWMYSPNGLVPAAAPLYNEAALIDAQIQSLSKTIVMQYKLDQEYPISTLSWEFPMGAVIDWEVWYFDVQRNKFVPLSAYKKLPGHHSDHHDAYYGRVQTITAGSGGFARGSGGPLGSGATHSQAYEGAGGERLVDVYGWNPAGGGGGGGGGYSFELVAGKYRGTGVAGANPYITATNASAFWPENMSHFFERWMTDGQANEPFLYYMPIGFKTSMFEIRMTSVPIIADWATNAFHFGLADALRTVHGHRGTREDTAGPWVSGTATSGMAASIVVDTTAGIGLRNVKVRYNVSTDMPDEPQPPIPGPLTTERAVIVRHTSTNAHDGTEKTYWECAPQGAAKSVVPFYLDLRNTDGSGSIFDTLKLVPLWTGPSMSLYWTNDDFVNAWTLSPNRQNVVPSGSTPPAFVAGSGIGIFDNGSSWTIDNDHMRADLTGSFVMGIEWTIVTTDTAEKWLWEFENGVHKLGLRFKPTSATGTTMTGRFEVVSNDTIILFASNALVLTTDTTYGVVIGHNDNDIDSSFPHGWYITMGVTPSDVNLVTQGVSIAATWDSFYPTQLRLGNRTAEDKPCLGYLSRVWMRLDPYHDSFARSYLTNPDAFIIGSGNQSQRVNGFYCGILAAKFQSNTVARVGPGAGFYAAKTWTPVPVDYTLSTSRYTFPLLNAKYLKLEFSNLVQRTYLTDQTYLPVTDFPQWVTQYYRKIPEPKAKANLSVTQQILADQVVVGVLAGQLSLNQLHLEDSMLTYIRSVLGLDNSTPAAPISIYQEDQSTIDFATNMQSFDPLTAYKELQFAATLMKFFREARHEYDISFVPINRHAFFVGIKELQVIRSDYTIKVDTPEYRETFDDYLYIETGVDA